MAMMAALILVTSVAEMTLWLLRWLIMALVVVVDEIWFLMFCMTIGSCSRCKIVVTKINIICCSLKWCRARWRIRQLAPANLPFCFVGYVHEHESIGRLAINWIVCLNIKAVICTC